MAIYHLNIQTIGRSGGGNAKAAAAYRSGEKIGSFDYTRKKGVDYEAIFTPSNAPAWCANRAELWGAVEEIEKRKDAQVCREINFALPLELKREEREELVKEYAAQFTALGMVADVTIHHQDSQNPHAHMMLTMREITTEGFGKKNREWNSRDMTEQWRVQWSEVVNHALERAGRAERIDHRTLKAQGINREPTIHMGKVATALERRGEPTLRGEMNAAIKAKNTIQAEIEQTQQELKALEQVRSERAAAPITPTPATEKPIQQPELKKTKILTDLQGFELLAEIRELESRAWGAIAVVENVEKSIERAKTALWRCERDIKEHNEKIEKMGFWEKAKAAAKDFNNREAKALDAQWAKCAKELEQAKAALPEAEKSKKAAYAALDAKRAEYEKTPHARAVAEEKLEQERKQKERALERGKTKSRDIGWER